MAGIYTRRYSTTNMTAMAEFKKPAVLRWRSESYQVNNPRVNRQSSNNYPTELKVIELRKLSFTFNEQYPSRFQGKYTIKLRINT